MRAALVRTTAVLMAIGIAAAACGDDPADPAPTSPPPASATGSPPAPSPSASDAEAQVEFCADLNGFATAAGPAFDLGILALIDGESANERKDLSGLVDSMVLHGTLLQARMPAELADDLRTVVAAAGEAKAKLAAKVSAGEAVEPLQTEKVKAAREAVVAYRGSC
ncbi:hypothetical protein ACTMTJ_10580 [Phytohabitans sp. LJ34]|uniref:hypothetical protein n=1 Tax=Phytohabitans sp. LJ34 TaxID=3452217 RepID=UPI003F8AA96B